MAVGSTSVVNVLSTSGNDVVSTSGVDVVSMSYTDLGDCSELKGPPETPLPNVDNILLEE